MTTIDARRFTFDKWILPKTASLLDKGNSIAIGYFDFIDIEKISLKKGSSPLESYPVEPSAYTSLQESDLSCQQILAFTNVTDQAESDQLGVYTAQDIQHFWNDGMGFLTYVALVHIMDNADPKAVIEKVDCLFNTGSNQIHAICYLSLDYSDIIICVKGVSIKNYLLKIFSLNYDQEDNKLIRDSFSLISIDNSYIKQIFKKIKVNDLQSYSETKELIRDNDVYATELFDDTFTVSFNLGVQNYNIFHQLEEDLDAKKVPFKYFLLLGRHDISLYNNKADFFWILYMMYYIDKYSTKGNTLNRENILFNCETFIRIPSDNNTYNYKDSSSVQSNDNFSKAQKILAYLLKNYQNQVESININQFLYLKPIHTLKESILGILKNEFADEFVLCFFEAFCKFLIYITNKIKNNVSNQMLDKFNNCFNEFFDILNSLINSAMHSERQFIQSPSFNAVFYDIPPKLLAFYTASTHNIIEIIKNPEDKEYSFIFRPSFWSYVCVDTYSYIEQPPASRLLSVYINEKMLYHPAIVMRIMCHEVAHYAGDKNRCRERRKDIWLKSVLFELIDNFIKDILGYKEYTENEEQMIYLYIKAFTEEIAKTNKISSDDLYTYSISFENVTTSLMQLILYDLDIKKFNYLYFNNNGLIKEIGVYKYNELFREFKIYLIRVIANISTGEQTLLNQNKIYSSFIQLSEIYSETYADLQMILVLNLDLEQYINSFIVDENQSADDIRLGNTSAYYRIFNIIYLFHKLGIWHINIFQSEDNEVNKFTAYIKHDIQATNIKTRQYNDIIGKNYWILNNLKDCDINYRAPEPSFTADTHYNPDLKIYLIAQLQYYLLCVLDQTCQSYENKKKSIKSLRRDYQTIGKFSDSISVFNHIRSVNLKYAAEIYDYDYWKKFIPE